MDKELIDQPAPKFTLLDLERQLTDCYSILLKGVTPQDIRDCTGKIQELLTIVTSCKTNLESIELPVENNPIIQQTLNIDKPELSVCGVQLWENGVLKGTSLYTTIIKARIIRDTLNKEFAKLKVNHEAKIINYPVF
jgi:hypothetical protein